MSGLQVKQPIREITVWHQRDNFSAKVQTDAVTWGQFKEQNKKEFDFKNVRGVVKATKNTLDHKDARLPEGNCLIFLFPMKVKSGMNTKAEYEKTYNAKELRNMCSERGLGTSGNKADFAKRLADHDKEESIKSHEVKETIVRAPLQEETKKTTAIAPVPANVGFATVEAATVTTKMTVRINDVSQLNNLLEVMFPGMEVVSVDALVDLTAELKLGVPQAPVAKPVVEEPEAEATEAEVVEPVKEKKSTPSTKTKPTKKAPKKAEKKAKKSEEKDSGEMSDAEMRAMANEMKGDFNF